MFVQDSSKSCTPRRHDSMWGLLKINICAQTWSLASQFAGILAEGAVVLSLKPSGGVLLATWKLFQFLSSLVFKIVLAICVFGLWPNQADHQQLFSLGRGRTHDWLATGIVLCYMKSLHMFKLLFLLVAVSHSGHPDSPVRGNVICYTKSFHLLNLFVVRVAVSHSATRIHLSEGLWYVAQSLSGPHMGGGWMHPCREGSC